MSSIVKPHRNKDLKKKGRPAGAKNKTTLLAEAIKGDFERSLKTNFRQIMAAVVEKAKEGDMQAVKLLFDKVIPNASNEEKQIPKDFSINIVMADMAPKAITGEVIENDDIQEVE